MLLSQSRILNFFRSDNFSFSNYGTVLFINSVEYTPDGRSLITTTGEKRFKVTGRNMRDGYNCATIQFLYDEPVTDTMEIGKEMEREGRRGGGGGKRERERGGGEGEGKRERERERERGREGGREGKVYSFLLFFLCRPSTSITD